MSYVDDPYWNCDLSENEETLVAGLKLVGGCDLLEPYQLGLGKLIMTGAVPTLDNLGVENHLIWVEP